MCKDIRASFCMQENLVSCKRVEKSKKVCYAVQKNEGKEGGLQIMKETVLLINFKNDSRLREIQMLLFLMKIKMKLVEQKDYLQPVGALVGVDGIELAEALYEGDTLEREMMVLAGFSDNRLNQLLYLMKKSKIRRVDYKAVVTETNQHWNIIDLYAELKREHEAFQAMRRPADHVQIQDESNRAHDVQVSAGEPV